MMELELYRYSLCLVLPLLLFFGIYFLVARVPDKPTYQPYVRSRKTMGVAMLALGVNYAIHFLTMVRFENAHYAILLNISTYSLCFGLFSIALITLLEPEYFCKRQFFRAVPYWLGFTVLALGVILVPDGLMCMLYTLLLDICLMAYGSVVSIRILKAYFRARKRFDETNAEDIGSYIRWLSNMTYIAVIYGVGCTFFTLLPDNFIYLWILSSLGFYIYVFVCYRNYMLSIEVVEAAMDSSYEGSEKAGEAADDLGKIANDGAVEADSLEACAVFPYIEERIKKWIDEDGYVRHGFTINDLAREFYTNRTYLSSYINSVYHVPFRQWVSGLRIEYAKRIMIESPERKISDIAEASGFQSPSHFTKSFRESEGCSPAVWRRSHM